MFDIYPTETVATLRNSFFENGEVIDFCKTAWKGDWEYVEYSETSMKAVYIKDRSIEFWDINGNWKRYNP